MSIPVLGTRSFVMKVRSRQGVEKLARSFMAGERGADYEALYKVFNSQ